MFTSKPIARKVENLFESVEETRDLRTTDFSGPSTLEEKYHQVRISGRRMGLTSLASKSELLQGHCKRVKELLKDTPLADPTTQLNKILIAKEIKQILKDYKVVGIQIISLSDSVIAVYTEDKRDDTLFDNLFGVPVFLFLNPRIK